ncbi:DgyrCDS1212 [Dimorphilus gyrociliatus]|uniref:DgyrCDS1212 n=1 Tax=Dimorphilus gyrociliatus TaxID=2664684 RepID=A0A7I8V8N7_9ANNE|nr:DgyrCDS1212 [Dimorphilus gyrociliatus]
MTSYGQYNRQDYSYNDKYFKGQNNNTMEKENENNECSRKTNPLVYISTRISGFLETFFYRFGIYIGTYPLFFILFSIVLSVICIGGLTKFREEVENIWVPSDSIAVKNKAQARSWFPSGSRDRIQFNIFESDNVLKPSVLLEIYDFEERVKSISGTERGNFDWNSVCKRVNGNCAITSLNELWEFNRTVIAELTNENILEIINKKVLISPYQKREIKLSRILGGIIRNKTTGEITSATAAKTSYTLNFTETDVQNGRKIDENALAWEEKFIDLSKDYSSKNLTLFYYSMRTFLDEGSGTILKDLGILAGGYILLIAFVIFVLGKRNCVQHRVWLSVVGIITIGLSILWSFGLCSYGDWYFTGLHNVLPFLFLGIGVDDIFIIVQALDNLKGDQLRLPLHEKIGLALKHAGVSITITSLTDVLAFAVGSSTILPALRSFCVFAAVGILGLFIFQLIFFTPFMALDEARRSGMPICRSLWNSQAEVTHLKRENVHRKNACIPMHIHSHWRPMDCSNKNFIHAFFENYYSRFITFLPAQLNIVIMAVGCLAVMAYGTTSLKQDFDPRWFFPSDSYATEYIKADERHFGGSSQQPAALYVGDINFHTHLTSLEGICDKVSNHYWVKEGTLDCWARSFRSFLNSSSDAAIKAKLDNENLPKTESDFIFLIANFIKDQPENSFNLVFNGDNLTATKIPYQNTWLDTSSKRIDALADLRSIAAANNIPPELSFPFAEGYTNIDTDKVIKDELLRNIGLAFLAVYLITLFLLANFTTSLFVSCCVIMTLVDLAGMMYFWDLTIDTVTTIQLIISIGLSVDYAVHIAHTFLISKGTRKGKRQFGIL